MGRALGADEVMKIIASTCRKNAGLCYCLLMNPSKSPQKKTGSFVLGRARFEAISAVEGIRKTAESRRMFDDFDRKGLTAEQRRRAIFEKYARKA